MIDKEKTLKELGEKYIPCTCGDMYLSRNMTAPDCPLHAFDWEAIADEYAQAVAIDFETWKRKTIAMRMDEMGLMPYKSETPEELFQSYLRSKVSPSIPKSGV